MFNILINRLIIQDNAYNMLHSEVLLPFYIISTDVTGNEKFNQSAFNGIFNIINYYNFGQYRHQWRNCMESA